MEIKALVRDVDLNSLVSTMQNAPAIPAYNDECCTRLLAPLPVNDYGLSRKSRPKPPINKILIFTQNEHLLSVQTRDCCCTFG